MNEPHPENALASLCEEVDVLKRMYARREDDFETLFELTTRCEARISAIEGRELHYDPVDCISDIATSDLVDELRKRLAGELGEGLTCLTFNATKGYGITSPGCSDIAWSFNFDTALRVARRIQARYQHGKFAATPDPAPKIDA